MITILAYIVLAAIAMPIMGVFAYAEGDKTNGTIVAIIGVILAAAIFK